MPKVGVEPTLPEGNYALNVARLPIPPLRQVSKKKYTISDKNVNIRIVGKSTVLRKTQHAIMRVFVVQNNR